MLCLSGFELYSRWVRLLNGMHLLTQWIMLGGHKHLLHSYHSTTGGVFLAIHGGHLPWLFKSLHETLFQTNTYKANVRKYSPGCLVQKMNTINLLLLTVQSRFVFLGIRSGVCCLVSKSWLSILFQINTYNVNVREYYLWFLLSWW